MSIVLLAAAVLCIGSFSRDLEFNASIKSFIISDDPDYEFYRDYRTKFGQDEILVLAFEDDDIFTPGNIASIRRLTERIEALDNVYDVRSLTNVEYMKNSGDSFDVLPIVEEDLPNDAQEYLAAQKRIAVDNRILCQDIISGDARKTSILVTLAAMEDGYRYEREIREMERIIQEESKRTGKTIHFSGERYLDERFLRYMHRDLQVFIPLTCLVLGLLLYMIFRNVRDTVIGLTAISACLMCVMGLIPLTGWKMNSVTAGLPSLVLCIAVTDVVHIIHAYRRIIPASTDRFAALTQTLKEVTVPCFLTSLTTAIGFGSLILNSIRPIKGFGLLAALGVSICFIVCIIVVPVMLLLWKSRDVSGPAERSIVPSRVMGRLAELLIRRRRHVTYAVIVCLAVMGSGMFMIKVQANRIRYLRTSSRPYRAVQFIDDNLAGTTELDVVIESGKDGTFKEPVTMRKVEALAVFLRGLPGIDKVICINDFIKDMNQAFHEDNPEYYRLPDTRDTVADFLLLYSMSGNRNELNRYNDYPYSRTRISVRTSEQNSARLDTLITSINAYLAEHFDTFLDAKLASVAVSNNNVFHYLVRGLMIGLVLAAVLVGLVMCLNFKSFYIGMICMIPNIVPLAACLGLLGWSGTWLEIATAMTFSIALGISVDDTIHLMSRFKLELSRTRDYHEAFRATMNNIGPALVETTIIIMGGFLILLCAGLKMNMTFGLLCAFIMLMALLSDLIVTPICLLVFKPFKRDVPQVIAAVRPRNGVYEGRSFKFPWAMRISVAVENGRISRIHILKHVGPEKHLRMLQAMIGEMIGRQRLDVDAVTGATISSKALARAVSDAVSKAN